MDYIITTHKQIEQTVRYLTVIAEQTREAVIVADFSGAIQFVNTAWATMHGYENCQELIGKQINVFHTKEQMKTDVIPFIEEVKHRGRLAGPVEHVRRNGTPFPTEMLMVLLKDQMGKALWLIGFATDITKQERIEEELRRYRYLTKEYGRQIAAQLTEQVSRVRQQFNGHFGRALNNKRSRWADDIVENTTRKQKITPGQFSAAFGRLSRHPVFGIPILFMVILLMYLLVVNVANGIAGWMNQILWVPVESKINSLVTVQWLNDFLIGDYGVLSLGLANAFFTILPILAVFFLAFNIIEDIGYIPNLCVLTKRIFDKLGLSGSAIMPLVLAFGCKTMATLTTKSLRSKKERYIAIYLIAFAIPCSTQMALNMSILGRMGIKPFVIAFSVLAFVEIAAGVVLNKILKEEERSDFYRKYLRMERTSAFPFGWKRTAWSTKKKKDRPKFILT